MASQPSVVQQVQSITTTGFSQLAEENKMPLVNPFVKPTKDGQINDALRSDSSQEHFPTADDPDEETVESVLPTNATDQVRNAQMVAKAGIKRKVKTVAKKGLKHAITKGLSHFAPGISSVVSVFAAYRSHKHIERLNTLAGKECTLRDGKAKGVCAGILAYVVHQKESKRRNAIVKAVPGVSLVQETYDAGKNAVKRIQGTQGTDRGTYAAALVRHALDGCAVGGAIFVEITMGDFYDAGCWKAGRDLLSTNEATGAAKDKMQATS